jgi:hypothetical protein
MVIEGFAAFFKAANSGNAPFPWQERLVRKVAADRVWPGTRRERYGCQPERHLAGGAGQHRA